MILNMTYRGRLEPEAPYSVLPGPDEWKLLYSIASKSEKDPKKPYTIKEAVEYLEWLGDRNGFPAMIRRE
jgi:hypothetical protein